MDTAANETQKRELEAAQVNTQSEGDVQRDAEAQHLVVSRERRLELYAISIVEYAEKTKELNAERASLHAREQEIISGQDLKREAAQRHVYDEEVLKAQATGNSRAEAQWEEKITALEEKNRQVAEDLRRIRTRLPAIDAECRAIATAIWNMNAALLSTEVHQLTTAFLDELERLRREALQFCSDHGIELTPSRLDLHSTVTATSNRALHQRMRNLLKVIYYA